MEGGCNLFLEYLLNSRPVVRHSNPSKGNSHIAHVNGGYLVTNAPPRIINTNPVIWRRKSLHTRQRMQSHMASNVIADCARHSVIRATAHELASAVPTR